MTDTFPPETITTIPAIPVPDIPVTVGSLRFLAKEHLLNPGNYEKILQFINIRPTGHDWPNYWLRCLLLMGLLFCMAGVICFFAWNWADMTHFVKFAIIIVLIFFCMGITLWRGPDSLPGGLALLAAGLLAGPLLAVYGQYYQTGADAWELFRAWTLFLIPLALLGRQNGLWLAVWLIGSLWAALYIDQVVLAERWNNYFEALTMPVFLAAQFVVLLAREAVMYRARKNENSFLRQPWPGRIVAVCLLIILAGLTCTHIFNYDEIFYAGLLSTASLHIILYIALTVGGLYWYRWMRPDMLLVTFLLLGIIVQIMTLLFTVFDLINGAGMLFAAIVLLGLGFGASQLVLRWQRMVLSSKAADEHEHRQRLSELKNRLLYVKSYMLRELWQALALSGANEAAEALNRSLEHLTPWYIRLMLTICAWVAAVFLIIFLGFVISFTFDDAPEISLFIFSIIFIALAAMLTRLETLFLVQFGLALGIAGALALPTSVIWILQMESWFHIPVLISFIICYFAIPHQAMRCLAAFVCIFIGLDLLAGFYNFIFRLTLEYSANPFLGWAIFIFSTLLTVALLTPTLIAMLRAWSREPLWTQDPARDSLIRPMLIALTAAFLCFGGLWCTFGGYGWQGRTLIHDIYPRYYPMLNIYCHSGLAAGLALIYMAVKFSWASTASTGQKSIIITGAVLVLITGWWLPWFPIAILVLALSRYLGSLPLTGLTAFYLAACLSWYYINMHTTLLFKAYTLIGAGLVMLMAGYVTYRLFVKRIVPIPQGGENA